MADDFARVEGRILAVTPDAIQFARALEAPNWIPRSLLHFEDRAKIGDLVLVGDEARIRIRKWKADQLGYTGDRDGQTDDLFNGKGRPVL